MTTCITTTQQDSKDEMIESVEKVMLSATDLDANLLAEWAEAFPPSHALYNYNAKDDPLTALSVVHDAFAFAVSWLPREVVRQLASFPFDPHGPSSLLIRGLPVGGPSTDSTNKTNPNKGDVEGPPPVPPTPLKDKLHISKDNAGDGDKAWASLSTHVPLAETWLLGIGRLLGTLQAPPFSHGERGGLVNDMIPVYNGNFNEMTDLRMHRDFPRQLKIQYGQPESEIFILLAVRGDPAHNAKTVVMDSAKLIARMDPDDLRLLSTYPIQCQKQPSLDQDPIDYGSPFCVVEEDAGVVTLLEYPHRVLTCPQGGEAVIEAYHRLEQMAWDCGERIDLQQGDMLIINNCRLVHGRTAYQPKMDGTDRWLVKCYVNSQVWGRPGTGNPCKGVAQFPNFFRS